MKYILSFLFIAAAWMSGAQTARIADNNSVRPAGANIYSTLQAAIDAAQPNDIVYITPSVTSYGEVTLAKKITLQGIGFTGSGDRSSTLGTLYLTSSTDGVNSVSGSLLRGFIASNILFTANGIGTATFDNIVIEKIYVGSYVGTNGPIPNRLINNLVIRGCYIGNLYFNVNNGLTNSKIYNNVFTNLTLTGSGILNNMISNNIITASGSGWNININTSGIANNTLILNNLFTGLNSAFYDLDGVICNNNIFYGMTPTALATINYFKNNTFSNNLVPLGSIMPPPANGGGSNSGTGNIATVSPNFVSVANTNWASTYDYTLNTGSLAKNAGSDGTDMGITGGSYPMSKNYQFVPTAVPLITEFNTSGVVPQNQPLKVTLKAKSN